MPFMKGIAPVRRTLKYLKAGKIKFQSDVKIFSINYNTTENHHKGAEEFVFWHLPQIQYKNPSVQCICFKNLTPSPFIRVFFGNGKSLLIDVDSRDKEEIVNHLIHLKTVCKSREEIAEEDRIEKSKASYAFFGYGCPRHCICEVTGQVPCSALVPVPKIWRGIPPKVKKFQFPAHYMELGLVKPTEEE